MTNQLESVLTWIQSQSSSIPPRAQSTRLKDKYENTASSKEDEEDNPNGKTSARMAQVSHQPFKVEARIDIPTFNGSVKTEKLDSWI